MSSLLALKQTNKHISAGNFGRVSYPSSNSNAAFWLVHLPPVGGRPVGYIYTRLYDSILPVDWRALDLWVATGAMITLLPQVYFYVVQINNSWQLEKNIIGRVRKPVRATRSNAVRIISVAASRYLSSARHQGAREGFFSWGWGKNGRVK